MPRLEEVTFTWSQPAACGSSECEERIEITAHRVPRGYYLTITTTAWAFETPQDLKNLLNIVTDIIRPRRAAEGE